MSATVVDMTHVYLSEIGRLRKLVLRIVGNRATAEDVVHQAFERLLGRVQDESIRDWPAYLTTAVRHLAYNHLRDTSRHAEVSIGDSEWQAFADDAPSQEMVAVYRSELRRLLRAVASLPSRRREAFVLNKFEGLSYDEIADRLKISRNTVISHIVLALADLDKHLQ